MIARRPERLRRRDRRGRIGQALVEFALVIPIFMLVLLGIVEVGRLVATTNAVAGAAREAARLATVQAPFLGATGPACTAPVCPPDSSTLRTNVLAAASTMTVLAGTVPSGGLFLTCTSLGSAPTGAWTGGNDCATSNTSGNVASVRINLAFTALTPIFQPFSPGTISGTATMAIP